MSISYSQIRYATYYDCVSLKLPPDKRSSEDWTCAWLSDSAAAFSGRGSATLFHGTKRNFQSFIERYRIENLRQRKETRLSIAVSDNVDCGPLSFNRFHELDHVPFGDDLPYPGCSFDVFCCDNIPGYLTPEEQHRYISEIRRVVKPGGLVIMSLRYLLGTKTQSMEPIMLSIPQSYTRYITYTAYRVDIRNIFCNFGVSIPHNVRYFPGFEHFDEKFLNSSDDLIIDRWNDSPDLPDVLRTISVLTLGLSTVLPSEH